MLVICGSPTLLWAPARPVEGPLGWVVCGQRNSETHGKPEKNGERQENGYVILSVHRSCTAGEFMYAASEVRACHEAPDVDKRQLCSFINPRKYG